MVPAARILERAREIGADFVGLSGLITPSLDEMVHVASEMEREGFTIPLLIGGATTSRAHTAVKIAPAYSGPVIHVTDASRAVGVVRALLDPARREAYAAEVRDEYEAVRRERGDRRAGERRLTLAEARANRLRLDWAGVAPPRAVVRGRPDVPATTRWRSSSTGSTGRRSSRPGSFAAPTRRSSTTRPSELPPATSTATPLALLERIVASGGLRADAVVGFWPANAVGDDIVIWRDDGRTEPRATFRTLRQQMAKRDGRPNLALADFVAPVASGARRLRRGVCRDGRPRPRRRSSRDFEAEPRRLLGDPRQGARRPAGRGLRGATPRTGPTGAVGIRARRGALATRSSSRSATRGSGQPPAIRPAPTTPRSGRSSPSSRRRRGQGSG